MRKLLIFLLLLGVFSSVSAEELSQADTRAICDKAMSLFSENRIKDGYELFVPYWPLPKSEITALVYQTESQWDTVHSRFGDNAGFEFIETEHVGKSLLRHIYLQKFMNHSLRWRFTFYKPKDKWRVNSIKFDDKISLLFK